MSHLPLIILVLAEILPQVWSISYNLTDLKTKSVGDTTYTLALNHAGNSQPPSRQQKASFQNPVTLNIVLSEKLGVLHLWTAFVIRNLSKKSNSLCLRLHY